MKANFSQRFLTMITRVIYRDFANMRLDRFCARRFPNERAFKLFSVIRKRNPCKRCNGKAPQMLREGDTVCISRKFQKRSR